MFKCCPVCYWEDDGQDDGDADVVHGGPNSLLSLTEARENYLHYGACEKRFRRKVRPPYPNELLSKQSVLPQTSDEYGNKGERSRGRGRASCTLVVVFTLLSIAIFDLLPYFQYKRGHARMMSLVALGMDIDDAGALLSAEGFDVGHKYHPTDNKDYYWIDIDLARRTPASVLVLKLIGVNIKFFHYGCLEAGLDEKVRGIM